MLPDGAMSARDGNNGAEKLKDSQCDISVKKLKPV